MKATGIVRRIDDLGRVVIPKEIRRTMRIREGDPLEIYTSRDGEVIFKKYSLMGGLDDFAAQFCETLSKSCGATTKITRIKTPDTRTMVITRLTGRLARLTGLKSGSLRSILRMGTLRINAMAAPRINGQINPRRVCPTLRIPL